MTQYGIKAVTKTVLNIIMCFITIPNMPVSQFVHWLIGMIDGLITSNNNQFPPGLKQ